MYTINENKLYNSIEISFDNKPNKAIRTALCNLKFRYHSKKNIWYGYSTIETVKNALENAQNKNDDNLFDNNTTTCYKADNGLKQQYIDMVIDETFKNDEKMREHFNKSIFEVVKLKDGQLIEIPKSNIETRFCFGYGYSNDYKSASDTMQYARKNSDYFINENLKSLEFTIKSMQEHNVYIGVAYSNAPKDTKIYTYYVELDNGAYHKYDKPYYILLDNDDKQLIINALLREKASFTKRLNTYLKRYGLTKLRTWTYCQDD